MASFSESILAVFILVGFYTRTSTLFLGFTMLVAFSKHFFSEGLKSGEMALLYLIMCIVIYLLGPCPRRSMKHYIFSFRVVFPTMKLKVLANFSKKTIFVEINFGFIIKLAAFAGFIFGFDTIVISR